MFRRRTSRGFRRSPRPRTRWLAFTGHAMTFAGTNTWDSQIMELEDSAGPVLWQNFVGGTVLRTIVDYVWFPLYPTAISMSVDYTCWLHLGFFMTEESIPSQDRWDPNTPHGDFMWRKTDPMHLWMRRDAGTDSEFAIFHAKNAGLVEADSTAKRRIREDEAMWTVGHYFASGASIPASVGYTGRVLIQLP